MNLLTSAPKRISATILVDRRANQWVTISIQKE